MPVETLRSPEDLSRLRDRVAAATLRTLDALRALCELDPIAALAQLKFSESGWHPLEDRPLNLVEQINQTFTYLTSFAAAEEVGRRHPDSWPIQLNLGTSAGSDVASTSAGVAAEVFSAVRSSNNDKLWKDIAKVTSTGAAHKYVFFYCPGETCPLGFGGAAVQVVALTAEQVLGPLRRFV